MTPGPTNLQPVNGHLYVPRQFGSRDAMGNDLFEKSITNQLGKTVRFVDNWDFYHRFLGEVHCGAIVKRALPSANFNWWENQP